MSSLVVNVQAISDVAPHPNADRLELAIIGGWQCVVPKGKYQTGDKIVYFPPDTLIPRTLAESLGVTQYLSFAKDNPDMGRIRCAKLRGEPSFGLVADPDCKEWAIGQDVAEHYGAEKWIPPVKFTAGDAAPDHPLFVTYTNIENLRNFPNVLHEGENLYITEKLHGCLSYSTRISMADGTTKRIVDVEPGDRVLGIDSDGRCVASKVLHKFNNGQAERWLTVKGKRLNMGRGSHFFSVHCTPNHQFYIPSKKKYVAAQGLAPGDTVLLLRSELGLTPLQEQVVVGKLLGDGHYHDTPTGGAVHWGHKEEHKEYVEWTARAFGDLACGSRRQLTSGYGTTMIVAHTAFNPHLKEFCQDFIDHDGKKVVPPKVADLLGPVALAFWYMDDGSLAHADGQEDRALFAVCNFDKPSCDTLISALARLGVKGVLYEAEGHLRIRLNADDAERLFLLIAPYVPLCMQYKLPERYRGHQGWLPLDSSQYKPMLVEQTVDEIVEDTATKSAKWDLETETHNFFANSVLVHNSNCRVAMIDGELMAGSHRVRRKEPEDYASNRYWFPLSLPSVRNLLACLSREHKQVILFGEVFGKGIQKLEYGQTGLAFNAFDLLVDGKYLNAHEFLLTMYNYSIPHVPTLGFGPFTIGAITDLAKGKSTIEGSSHIKEGVVIRPICERTDPRVGRVILKYVSDEYLLSQKEDWTDA